MIEEQRPRPGLVVSGVVAEKPMVAERERLALAPESF
jgi:hypothetical protein